MIIDNSDGRIWNKLPVILTSITALKSAVPHIRSQSVSGGRKNGNDHKQSENIIRADVGNHSRTTYTWV